ncbi:penicillin-binding protein 1A [Cytobacillus oceanisediminis]|uniref:transglycosylase domain-containing protein n=1 Tax=Cytobacillus TaxID=2675230 RepID=UPI00203E7AF0|nr:penicillin-binding protein 1A [Cytobacillus oceanisediminis]MBY0159919.1 penicillin-binding protein 1A [Cytobacillus firmus]MCM3392196.1 penicillin-binding protein 1A [Cytobacillus oceanisediminis]MCM3528605.1 penicillin-binding protein 1A [Cytobacillus oceanisediminis]
MRKRTSFFKKFQSTWIKLHLTQVSILLASTLVLAFLSFVYFSYKDADISALEAGLAQSTVIYDADEEVASKISANKNEGISIDKIPDHMKNAVIAIEDHRFYEHGGIDLKGIGRAFFTNLKAGGIVEGGSTLTQQLTKNALLSAEKTYKRKLEEFFLAIEIEKEYSKDEILQMYLNQVYFGEGAWGIKRAAMKYYAKDVEDLSISEAALLAGLVKAPSAINPYQNEDKAIERRNLVLDRMKEHSFISEKEWEKAKNEKLVFEDGGGDPLKGKYPYYVDVVLEEAINKYNISLDDLLSNGYQIYTELDQDMQGSVEETYKNDQLFPKGTGEQPVQSGAILLDPHNGGIRALAGGRGEHTLLGHNRAVHKVGQPGSTMKPIVPYAAALEAGWEITDELKDERMTFGEDYEPNNYNGQFRGNVPMYEAVKDSLNVPAVWLLDEIGVEKGVDAAKRFGIPEDAINQNLALALGGTNEGVSPLTMAQAYAVFANGGERPEAHSITKIVDKDGETVAEWKGENTRVISKDVADKVTTMLLGVVQHGTGKAAQIPGREVAGKTGSTQMTIEGIDGVKDQWFVGYTPQLVGAVWVGHDMTDAKNYLTTSSSEGTAPIFREIMTEALKNQEAESFNVPQIAGLMEQRQREQQRKAWEKNIRKETEKIKEKIEKEKEKWKEKWSKEKEKDKEKDKNKDKDKEE